MKIYRCPRCDSSEVFAGYQIRGPMTVIQAGCNGCGFLRQQMIHTRR